MERLSVHPMAFIRPSPSGGNLGGVAERTRESMLVCEAAGYDIVIVETVGVGQSEIALAGMVDLFVLMQLPNAGDELQAIKRGVMEVADLVLVNKADLDADAALRAQSLLASALRILSPQGGARQLQHEIPSVLQVSALQGNGIAEFCAAVQSWQARRQANGQWQARRAAQSRDWLMERIEAGLKQRFWSQSGIEKAFDETLRAVQAGALAASTGARRLLGLADAGRTSARH